MLISDRELTLATLDRQLLLRREPLDIADGVHKVVAIQAQEPASPYIGLWSRVDSFDPADLDAAFRDRRIVRASLLRGTLHVVHADDYTRFHESLVAGLRASRLLDRRYRTTGLTTDEADALIPELLNAIDTPRTAIEIEAFLAGRLGAGAHPRLWWALKTYAPIVHAPRDQVWSFARTSAFQPGPTEPARVGMETSVQHLILRYIAGFGPATATDIGQFTSLRQSAVKPALDALSDLIVIHEGSKGSVLYDIEGQTIPEVDTPTHPRLLPMWDSILLAYADRRRILPELYRRIIIRGNGDVLPTLLVDGQAAGVWRATEAGIEVRSFQSQTEKTWVQIASEAAGLQRMLTDRQPDVFRRYHHWWSKLPDAEVRVFDENGGP